jgi:hypothetical protein
VAVAFPGKADACSCGSSGPPCQSLFQVDAVFAGTVKTISEIERTSDSPYRHRSVVFAIDRAFRGVQGTTAEVVTGMGGGDCGYDFKQGERYLVYAYRNSGTSRLATGICSRTRPIADAAEDLRYFEALPPSGTGARVYGTVTHWERDLATGQSHQYGPVPFVHVLLSGTSPIAEAQTDDQGRYEFAGIAPGKYELQVIPPGTFSPKYLQSKIELRDARACAVADFGVRYNGRISGAALNADGGPAAGIAIELMAVERIDASGFIETIRTETDSGGYFEFSEIPPGHYVVGVSLQRKVEVGIVYPRTFYPGTSAARDAVVINIGEGNREQLEPLRLPGARQSRELAGVVIGSDGHPFSGAFVALEDGEARWRQVAAGIKTDSDGRFKFVVYDGLSYTAIAWSDDPKHRQAGASVGPFVVTSTIAPLQLRLGPPNDR